jgi:hypothetical protein
MTRHLRLTLDWRIGYADVSDLDTDEDLLGVVLELPHLPVGLARSGPLRVIPREPDDRACKALAAD